MLVAKSRIWEIVMCINRPSLAHTLKPTNHPSLFIAVVIPIHQRARTVSVSDASSVRQSQGQTTTAEAEADDEEETEDAASDSSSFSNSSQMTTRSQPNPSERKKKNQFKRSMSIPPRPLSIPALPQGFFLKFVIFLRISKM